MRTAEAMREHMRETLKQMCQRPGMWGEGWGLETMFLHQLYELCWLDEREGEFKQVKDDLIDRGVFTCRGVNGSLNNALPGIDFLVDEIASIYGEQAYRLGYLTVNRILTKAEWERLCVWFKEPLTEDLRVSAIREQFGEPSWSTYHVDCYAGPDPRKGWLCFDYSDEWRKWTDETGQHIERINCDDFILRDRRRTTGKFKRAIELTPFGCRLLEEAKQGKATT